MATASCECGGGFTETDIFGNLPCDISHHILSFLSIKDLTRFGCVSKRSRQLYLSTPSLDLDLYDDDYVCASTCEKRIRLLHSLDRFLFLRGDNKIQCFRVLWESHSVGEDRERRTPCICRNEHFQMLTWVENAVRCNVEVLHLDLDIDEECDKTPLVPSCVLLCASLRVLVLGLGIPVILNIPPTFSSNLVFLKLINVELREGFLKWVSCSCKCIKELCLFSCRGIKNNIAIQSSSLETFQYVSDYKDRSHLDIVAPNLKCMEWSAGWLIPQNLEIPTCLDVVVLDLHPQVDDFQVVFEVLHNMRRVKGLSLSQEIAMVLFQGGSMPAIFENVCCFFMHIKGLLDVVVPAIVSLFRGMPNLSALSINWAANGCSRFNMEYWKSQNLAFVHKLEEVKIHVHGGNDAIEFVRYILEHANNLKNMTIVYTPEESDAIKEVNKSKRISNATIVFEESEQLVARREARQSYIVRLEELTRYKDHKA